MAEAAKPLSRSEREALIKDKAGWVIVVFAALLAINTYMGGSNSSKILNNTIDANNTIKVTVDKGLTSESAFVLSATAAASFADSGIEGVLFQLTDASGSPYYGKQALIGVTNTIAKDAASGSVFIRGSIVPLVTPDEKRGRVLAVENVFIGASNELGAFESGVASQAIGTAGAVVGGGIATVGIAAAWWVLFPALRHVDRFSDLEDRAEN